MAKIDKANKDKYEGYAATYKAKEAKFAKNPKLTKLQMKTDKKGGNGLVIFLVVAVVVVGAGVGVYFWKCKKKDDE